ncbi:179_t:CDS:2 [Entrophospora sp. SA101]|nr:179_t:CDS:2 [Entrophospora sp. SA101]CAJ0847018.1 12628_t:CDS:2 [Entrophospora sp. SA101]
MWIKSCIKPFLKQSLFNNKNIIIDNNTTNKLFTFTTIINNNIRFLSTLRTESINNDKFTTSNNVLIPENNYIIRPRGVRSALSTKYAQNQFIIVDKIKLKTHKTKDLLSILEKNAWDPFGKNQTEGNDAQQRINRVEGHSILFLTREHKKELDLASRNLQKVHALTANEIFEMGEVYNILGHEVLIIEKDAIQDFENLLRPL